MSFLQKIFQILSGVFFQTESSTSTEDLNQDNTINFIGERNISHDYTTNIIMQLEYEDPVYTSIHIATHNKSHCLLIVKDSETFENSIVFREISSYTSEYNGQEFSNALSIIQEMGFTIHNHLMERTFLDKVNSSRLTEDDVQQLVNSSRTNIANYIGRHTRVMPPRATLYGVHSDLVNDRLTLNRTHQFFPHEKVNQLEEYLRQKTNIPRDIKLSNALDKMFKGPKSILYWDKADTHMDNNMANYICSTFLYIRNMYMHNTNSNLFEQQRDDFNKLNELYNHAYKTLLRSDA